jgi:hypothetical protein
MQPGFLERIIERVGRRRARLLELGERRVAPPECGKGERAP